MNYIKHFNHWLDLVAVDDRLSSSHVSIYVALFQLWNKNRFPKRISVYRNEVMQVSKIGSSKTYYKCLHELHDFGYIQYFPSFNPLKGSVIAIQDLSDGYGANDNHPDDDSEVEPAKKICDVDGSTEVTLKQKGLSSCSKCDTGVTQLVTPLLINNKNLLNYKQGECGAHTKRKSMNGFSFLIQQHDPGNSEVSISQSSLDDGTEKSKPAFRSSSGVQMVCQKKVPRDFSEPSMEEVRDFFAHHLSGNYLNKVLSVREKLAEAEKFFYHYQTNGWLVGGKTPMRNWKTACRSWAAKIPYFTRNTSSATKNLHFEMDGHYGEPL